MFGYLFFLLVLNWEAMILRRTTHHLDNVNNDLFSQMTLIKHLNFGKVNLQGTNLIRGYM